MKAESSELPTTWFWIGNEEYYLEEDNSPVDWFEALKREGEITWSCSKDALPGDLVLMYWTKSFSRPGYGMHIAWICRVLDPPAKTEEWGWMCHFEPVAELASPLTVSEMRAHPDLRDWGPLRTNFRGYRNGVHIPEEQLWILLELIADQNTALRSVIEQHWNLELPAQEASFEGDLSDLEEQADPLDPANLEDHRRRTLATIVARRGQAKFRQELIEAYKGRCPVTGTNAEEALEAAHILGYLGPKSNTTSNGLLLRADIHTLFDLLQLAIDPDTGRVYLAPSLRKTSYRSLLDTKVKLPKPQCGGAQPSCTEGASGPNRVGEEEVTAAVGQPASTLSTVPYATPPT